MKTKKQKLPSKPRTIDDITGKPGGFKKFLKETSKTQQKQHSESLRKAIEIVSRNGKKRIKAARKPAHTEFFEGYGVMRCDGHLFENPTTGHVWFGNKEEVEKLQILLSFPSKVVKLRAEFKVI